MASKKRAATPLEQLEELLPKITNDELLEFVTRAFEEGAERAGNYAAILDEPASRDLVDALNEGLAFAVRLKALMPILGTPPRVCRAWHRLDDALDDLKNDTVLNHA